MISLEEIAVQLRNGKSVRQSDDAGGLPISRIETIAQGVIDGSRVGFAGLEKADCDGWLLEDGDILISHINSTKHLGKCAIYTGDPPALVHGMNLLGLRVKKEAALPDYVYRMMSAPGFRRQIPRITKHSVNQSSFNISNFKKLEIPLPPLAEQKRIAGILDAADALRAKRRDALAQLDTLLQATFLDMFGDPVTNPKGWEEVSVSDLCDSTDDVRCGPFGTQLQQHEFTQEGVPLWGVKHVNAGFTFPTDEFVTEAKAKKLAVYDIIAGDLVMTRKGTIGNCHVYPDGLPRGIMHSDLLRLRVSGTRANAQYITSQFAFSRKIQQQLQLMSPGAVMPGINVTKLKKLLVECPPIALQNQFADAVSSIDANRDKQRRHLAELDTLFASLQQRAFAGEL